MADQRNYNEREVGLILKRVAELHEREGEKPDSQAMTQAEIEQVVSELGISKNLVTRAAQEISIQDRRNQSVGLLGGKTDLMFEEIIDGKLDDATRTKMFEVLRRHLGDPGELKSEGATQIWTTTKQSPRRIHFTLVQQGDQTTLRLEENMQAAAQSTVGPIAGLGAFSGILAAIPLKVLVAKSILLLSLGPMVAVGGTLGWLGGRAIWKRRSQQQETHLREIFGEIITLAKTPTPMLPESGNASSNEPGD